MTEIAPSSSPTSAPPAGYVVGLCACIGAFLYSAYQETSLLRQWHLNAALLTAVSLLLSKMVTNRYLGLFIDARNVMSLSRLQMFAWTTMLLSAFLAAVFWNINQGIDQPIAKIALDQNLWVLMGISTTSLVASPVILGIRTSPPSGNTPTSLYTRARFEEATWKDLFTGEANGNADHFDLSRLQMFFFTAVSLVAYWVCLRSGFLEIEGIKAAISEKAAHAAKIPPCAKTVIPALPAVVALPTLPEGLLWMIGISHGGYLAMKGTQPNGGANAAAPAAPQQASGSAPAASPSASGDSGTVAPPATEGSRPSP